MRRWDCQRLRAKPVKEGRMGHQTRDQKLIWKARIQCHHDQQEAIVKIKKDIWTRWYCHQCFYVEAAAMGRVECLWLDFENMCKWKENMEWNDNILSLSQLWQFFLQIFTFLTIHFPDFLSPIIVTLSKVIWIFLLYISNGRNEISVFLLLEASSTLQSQGGDMRFSNCSQKYVRSNGIQKRVAAILVKSKGSGIRQPRLQPRLSYLLTMYSTALPAWPWARLQCYIHSSFTKLLG